MAKKLNRFAEIFSSEAEEFFLQDIDPDISYRTRLVDEKQRRKYAEKAKNILSEPLVAPILPVLKKYVARCIPEPYFTEEEFWSISYMNGSSHGEQFIGSISSYHQEIFTISYYFAGKNYFFSWHTSEKMFPSSYLFPCDVYADDRTYKIWGEDQIHLTTDSIQCALKLLDDPVFLKAAKKFNARSFINGRNSWGQFHCFQFADLIMP